MQTIDLRRPLVLCLLVATLLPGVATPNTPAALEPIEAARSPDRGFRFQSSGKRFVPWGFNYDHDSRDRLLEDYWHQEWEKVAADFEEMKSLGANLVRIHLQFARFMESPKRPNERSLRRLENLVRLAERTGLYLDVTGLGCYHRADVPPWYEAMSEEERWEAQSRFWHAVTKRIGRSPAVFCFNLMNEPVAPAGMRKQGDWLGPAFGGKHFVQMISLDQRGRTRHAIATAWIRRLRQAIRKAGGSRMVTVGLVDWSLERPGLTSGFVPRHVAPEVDFIAVHLYPESGKLAEAGETLQGFDVGKPVLVEETFPLRCSSDELRRFVAESASADGWLSFYWGTPPAELRKATRLQDALLLQWLEVFRKGHPGSPMR